MNIRFIALTGNTLRNFAVFGSQGVAVYLQFFERFLFAFLQLLYLGLQFLINAPLLD